jgi:hypothetical protein
MENETQTPIDKKMSTKVEWILILILGFLLGVAIKTEATKRITIGFSDYKVESLRQDYDISKIQNELIEKAKSQKEAGPEQPSNTENQQPTTNN